MVIFQVILEVQNYLASGTLHNDMVFQKLEYAAQISLIANGSLSEHLL